MRSEIMEQNKEKLGLFFFIVVAYGVWWLVYLHRLQFTVYSSVNSSQRQFQGQWIFSSNICEPSFEAILKYDTLKPDIM